MLIFKIYLSLVSPITLCYVLYMVDQYLGMKLQMATLQYFVRKLLRILIKVKIVNGKELQSQCNVPAARNSDESFILLHSFSYQCEQITLD